jgi:hypothetical protein
MGPSLIRDGKHGRHYNVVDLVNKREAEARSGRRAALLISLEGPTSPSSMS